MWIRKDGDKWIWGELVKMGDRFKKVEVTVLFGRGSAVYVEIDGKYVGTLYDGEFFFEAGEVEWEYEPIEEGRVTMRLRT